MLYYSLVYSRIHYDIVIWENAAKTYLQEHSTRFNNIKRTITFSSKFCHMTNLYKNTSLLMISEIYEIELAKFVLTPQSKTYKIVL